MSSIKDGCLFAIFDLNYQFVRNIIGSLKYESNFTGIIESYEYYQLEWTAWYANGKLHRLDGPAIIFNTEPVEIAIEYWFNGYYINCKTQEQFNLYVDILKLKGLV